MSCLFCACLCDSVYCLDALNSPCRPNVQPTRQVIHVFTVAPPHHQLTRASKLQSPSQTRPASDEPPDQTYTQSLPRAPPVRLRTKSPTNPSPRILAAAAARKTRQLISLVSAMRRDSGRSSQRWCRPLLQSRCPRRGYWQTTGQPAKVPGRHAHYGCVP